MFRPDESADLSAAATEMARSVHVPHDELSVDLADAMRRRANAALAQNPTSGPRRDDMTRLTEPGRQEVGDGKEPTVAVVNGEVVAVATENENTSVGSDGELERVGARREPFDDVGDVVVDIGNNVDSPDAVEEVVVGDVEAAATTGRGQAADRRPQGVRSVVDENGVRLSDDGAADEL